MWWKTFTNLTRKIIRSNFLYDMNSLEFLFLSLITIFIYIVYVKQRKNILMNNMLIFIKFYMVIYQHWNWCFTMFLSKTNYFIYLHFHYVFILENDFAKYLRRIRLFILKSLNIQSYTDIKRITQGFSSKLIIIS